VESGMESGKSSKIKVESGVEWPLSTLSEKIFRTLDESSFVDE